MGGKKDGDGDEVYGEIGRGWGVGFGGRGGWFWFVLGKGGWVGFRKRS